MPLHHGDKQLLRKLFGNTQCASNMGVVEPRRAINEETIQEHTICIQHGRVDLMKKGTTVILRYAKIDMFKGLMRLAVDKWGCVEVTDPADFTVKEDNNLSLIEYELVQVVEG